MADPTNPPGLPPVPPPPPPRVPPTVDRNIIQLGQLMAVLGQDPKYRDRILGLIEEAAPGVHIPERAVTRAATERVEAATKPLQDQNTQLADRLGKLEANLAQRQWQEEHGVDDEEFTAVKDFAKEKKIGDPTSALEYYRQAGLGRPRGSPTPSMTKESREQLYKNPKGWYEQEAAKIMAESRRRRSG
jgi:hypothetical protein